MNIALGIILGLVWGGIFSVLNYILMKYSVKNNTDKSVMLGNVLRMAINILCLGSVFLIRNSSAVSFVAAIVSAAAALSILNIVFSFSLMKDK